MSGMTSGRARAGAHAPLAERHAGRSTGSNPLLHGGARSPTLHLSKDLAWDQAGEVLADAARSLERAGADLLILCTNTMHNVADHIEAAADTPFLHLLDVTADAIKSAGLRRVGLLATAYSMEQPVYRDRLASQGVEVVVPTAADRQVVHRVIYDELCLGIISEASRSAYREVIQRLVADGCEGIILGCTEIELLIRQPDSPVPVFPSTRLHVEAAVDKALAANQGPAASAQAERTGRVVDR
jgi:aspartate racemase